MTDAADHRQRATPRALAGYPRSRHAARLPARPRADRRQGGLRRGGVRRLLGDGRPARRRRRAQPVDADQRLPGAGRCADGQEVVTAEGLGRPTTCTPCSASWPRAAARSAATARPASCAAWPRSTTGPDTATRTGPTASTCTRSAATCAAAPATARSATRRGRWAPPTRDDPLADPAAGPAPASRRPGSTRRRDFARPADLAEALALLAEHPDATVVAGCTDWGVEVNLRGRRAPYAVARRPAARAARLRR